MKRWKKILLTVVAVILLAQIPLIVGRFKIANRAERIKADNAARNVRHDPDFAEFVGVMHVHSSIGGHSSGSFRELIEAATANELDFVVMSEHVSHYYDTSALSLNRSYRNVLFVAGQEAETVTGDRFVMLEGGPEVAADTLLETPRFLEKYHQQGKVALMVYPERFKSWDADFDGIEVFSLNTNTKQNTGILTALVALWSYRSYPGLTLAETFRRPDDSLRRFDAIAEQRRISLFAGADAHSNIGFHILGDDAGNKLINIKIDPYESVFRVVRAHILIERGKELSKQNVAEAIRSGSMFVGFDIAGDSRGFSFVAESAGRRYQMGNELPFADDVRFVANSPIAARFVLLRNGTKIHETATNSELVFAPTQPGVYRVEVYRDELGSSFETMPWILSNPIYVR
jgi:hypothetical protein